MSSAWICQIGSQVAKHGVRRASWYVAWREPCGRSRMKSCGPGPEGKRLAKIKSQELGAKLRLGTYDSSERKRWPEFTAEYLAGHMSNMSARTKDSAGASLKTFERVLKISGRFVDEINARAIEQFINRRALERGKKSGSRLSPASLNKDLRVIKAALRKAKRLGYIRDVPEIEFVREQKHLPAFTSDEHFALIYQACAQMKCPADHPDPPSWWRGLLVTCAMTGWRISETLSLQWQDVDLQHAFIRLRAATTKGKRDSIVNIHPAIAQHISALRQTTDPRERVFAWNCDTRQLYNAFHHLQDVAGIRLACRIDREHACTNSCFRYGFHDLRRAFASQNAPRMSREALQTLMRHQSEKTTALYINYSQQIQPAVANLHVPEVLRIAGPVNQTSVAAPE